MKYICDMHAEAMEAVGEIQNWINDAQNTEFENVTESILAEWIDFISHQAWLIEKAVDEAEQAGIRMEQGLSTKRDRIDELEGRNGDLESENSDQASEIDYLQSEVSRLEHNVASLERRLGRYE